MTAVVSPAELTPRTYRDGVELLLRRGWAVLLFGFSAGWAVSVTTAWARLSAPSRVVATLFVIAAVVAGIRAFRGVADGRDVALLAAFAVLGPLALVMEPAGALARGLRPMPSIACAIGILELAPKGMQRASVAAAAAVLLVGESLAGSGILALETTLSFLAPCLATVGLVTASRRASSRADEAARDQARRAAESARQAASRAAVRDVLALLHDHVAAALRAISLREVGVSEARVVAAEATRALEASRTERTAAARHEEGALCALDDVIRHIPTPAGLEVTLNIREVGLLPCDVVRAFERAARESLRNVTRHARARRVTLSLAREGRTVILVVEDDGAGLPDGGDHLGFGLAHSVVRAMGDVGGDARFSSTTGRGTRVELTWREEGTVEPPPPSRVDLLQAALPDLRRALALVTLPFLAVSAYSAVRYSLTEPADNLPWLAWFGVLALVTVAVVLVLHVPARVSVLALTYAVCGVVASLVLAPPDVLRVDDYGTWPVAAITPLLAVLVTVRPPREALTAIACLQGAVMGLTLMGHLGDPAPAARIMTVTPLALSTVTATLMAWALSHGLLTLGTVVSDAEAERRRDAAARAAQQARTTIETRCLADLHDLVLPFLRSVADGTVGDSAVSRQRARDLELAVRDEMHLPGVLDGPARATLRTARATGTRVTIQADTPDGLAPAALRDVIIRTLAGVPKPDECVLTVRGSGPDVHVTIVAVPGDPGRAERLRHAFPEELAVLENSPDVLWAEWRPAHPDARLGSSG